MRTIEKVENIYKILRTESHHGFPVVDHHTDEVEIYIIYLYLFCYEFIF